MRLLTAKVLDPHFQTPCLVEVGEVGEGPIILGEAIAPRNVIENDLVAAAVFLVIFEGRREDIHLFRRAEGGGHARRRVALHAELAHKPMVGLQIVLDRFAGMPHLPVMLVMTGLLAEFGARQGVGGRRMQIRCCRVEFGHHGRQ